MLGGNRELLSIFGTKFQPKSRFLAFLSFLLVDFARLECSLTFLDVLAFCGVTSIAIESECGSISFLAFSFLSNFSPQVVQNV